MKSIPYYIVDVFAENRFGGNPLAVFLHGQILTDREMLLLAQEINYPETTFIFTERSEENKHKVRIFTPTEEIPFAGHPSLGTAYIIKKELLSSAENIVHLDLPAGIVPITFNNDTSEDNMFWMQQISPWFSKPINPSEILEVLQLDLTDIDSNYPIQEVSTGLPTLIIPLKNKEVLHQCLLNREQYFKLISRMEAKILHLFSPNKQADSEDVLCVRNFGDYYGISEEPATGSANGALAAYLIKNKYFGTSEINLRVKQEYKGRAGHLYLKAQENSSGIEVFVGGKVRFMAKGEFFI